MTLIGNKGEWSEVYAIFKILGDGKIHAGNKDLNKIEDIFYPIINLEKKAGEEVRVFTSKQGFVSVVVGEEEKVVSTDALFKIANQIFEEINKSTGVFEIPELDGILGDLGITKIKAPSLDKADVFVKVFDCRTNQEPRLGFSIKSQLGMPSTLLNAGKTTNILYKISGANPNTIKECNKIDSKRKIHDRIQFLINRKCEVNFSHFENSIFFNNCKIIDSDLPKIFANMVFDFFSSSKSRIDDLCHYLESENPIKYDLSFGHPFYSYKIKRVLTDIAIGMVPSKVWTGSQNANGGYLVVKKSGDVLCYHIYDRNDFEDYLFCNTKLETASTSKFDFGKAIEIDGEYYLKLNLQIRFIN